MGEGGEREREIKVVHSLFSLFEAYLAIINVGICFEGERERERENQITFLSTVNGYQKKKTNDDEEEDGDEKEHPPLTSIDQRRFGKHKKNKTTNQEEIIRGVVK